MKKLLFIFIAWIGILSLSGCWKNEVITDETTPSTNETLDATAMEETMENTQDNDSEPVITKNECMSACEMAWKVNPANNKRSLSDMGIDCNSLCDAQQGMQNNDTSACEKSEWILKESCYSEIAKKKKNADVCEKISEKMIIDACYLGVAEAANDASICDKMTDKNFKNLCTQNFKK